VCLSQLDSVGAILDSERRSLDPYFKGDQPRSIPSKYGSLWHSCSVMDDYNGEANQRSRRPSQTVSLSLVPIKKKTF